MADPKSAKIRRRSPEETERELAVNELGNDELPGGAEGSDESHSINTPFGDTDQHSSSTRLPRVRREHGGSDGR